MTCPNTNDRYCGNSTGACVAQWDAIKTSFVGMAANFVPSAKIISIGKKTWQKVNDKIMTWYDAFMAVTVPYLREVASALYNKFKDQVAAAIDFPTNFQGKADTILKAAVRAEILEG